MKKDSRLTIVISPLTFVYLLLTIAIVWVLIQISGIVLSLVAAGIFAIALNPVVSSIERKLHIRRGVAVGIVMVAIVGIFVLIAAMVVPNIVSQGQNISDNLPEYQKTVREYAAQQEYTKAIYEKSAEILQKNTSAIASNVTDISLGVAGGIFSFLTFFIFLIYMLASGRKFAVILSGLLPKESWREQFVKMLHDISSKLGRWLRGQAILCFIIFIFSYIGLSIFGVEYALSLALFAGLMEAVPMVGAYLGAIPAVLVALLTGSPIKALIVAVFFIVLQQIEGSVIVPQVMKKAVGVHPMIILLAAMIGGTLLGFVGVLIAVPFTAAASVVVSTLYKYYNVKIEK